MSAELYAEAGPGGSNGSAAVTSLEGSKPIHRFIRGQPKIIGTAVLIMGVSFFIFTFSVMAAAETSVVPSFLQGSLYITTGILYIVTEHNPTKKTVTISLALTIVTILWICWTILHTVSHLGHQYHYLHNHEQEEEYKNVTDSYKWELYSEAIRLSVDSVVVFHNLVGVIIMIVMTSLAVAALRSTKSQAIVVMTAVANETPVE